MKRLMRFELDKVISNKSYYICTIISLLFIVILSATAKGLQNLLLEEGAIFNGTAIQYALNGLSESSFYLLSGIFIAIFVCDDPSQGILKIVYGKGYSRNQVYFSKYIISLIAVIVMAILDIVGSYIAGYALFKDIGVMNKNIMVSFIAMFISVITYHALYFTVATHFQKTGSSIALNILGPQIITIALALLSTILKMEDKSLSDYWIEGLSSELSITVGKDIVLKMVGLFVYAIAFCGIGYYLNSRKEY